MKIKVSIFKFLIIGVLLISGFLFTNGIASASVVPICGIKDIGAMETELNDWSNQNELTNVTELEELQLVDEELVIHCGQGGISVVRMTPSDIKRTGNSAHGIKREYGYGTDSRFDLYRVVSSGQVVIVRITTRNIVVSTHYRVSY